MMEEAPSVREDPSALFSVMEAFGNQTRLNEDELFLCQDSCFDSSLIELKLNSAAFRSGTCIFHKRQIMESSSAVVTHFFFC